MSEFKSCDKCKKTPEEVAVWLVCKLCGYKVCIDCYKKDSLDMASGIFCPHCPSQILRPKAVS